MLVVHFKEYKKRLVSSGMRMITIKRRGQAKEIA